MWGDKGSTYTLFRMHVHLASDRTAIPLVVLTHYSECMFIPQISIILYNRHLLNIRALLFLFHNI